MKSGFVSVVMITIDRYQYIDSAISSIVQQSYKDWELIVLQDGTNTQIPKLLDSWMQRDGRIRYYRRDKIGNIANALNSAISKAEGEYIAILDDDDAWIDEQKLESQVGLFRNRNEIVAVGGGAIVIDGNGAEKMRYMKPLEPAECARRAMLANPIIHSTVMYRRSIAEMVGLYDETLPGYQDYDLWLKMIHVGEVCNLDRHFATYRVWDGGGSSTKVMGNAWSSLRIVIRHGRRYRYGSIALLLSVCYLGFALLPSGVRRRLYQILAGTKKRFFQ